jgi:hypothetical protein
MRQLTGLALIGAALLLSACTMVAPNYSPSVENVQSLATLPKEGAVVGKFTAKDGDEARVNDISMRGGTLNSPYGSYAAYVEAALRQELADAERINPASGVTINGVLLRNRLDASGIRIGEADIEVEFAVLAGNTVRYKKVHKAHHEWPSSFAGAVAIPAAQQNYHRAVQKLLASLFADPEFAASLKK